MWCYAAVFPYFFIMDARSMIPISIWLLHMSWETFYISLAGTAIFLIANKLGATPEYLLRRVVRITSGRIRNRSDNILYRRRSRLSIW
ncbi:IcmT/TraK family protein [Methylomarinum roseum]|uniref:IcmT/TraK family protein n=1 Tax=Methylomarinum roseum TaxID=3067653 RepID=UPI003D7E9A9D